MPLLFVIAFGIAVDAHAQDHPPWPDGRLIAEFGNATRLSIDGFGKLYVIDEGAGQLVRLTGDGLIRERFGGAGSPVTEPAGVDPTNGLTIFVTDRSSGRIIRLSRDLIPIGTVEGRRASDISRIQTDNAHADRRPIQPTDIAVGRDSDIFVIDREQRNVVQFNSRYQIERRVGAFGSGPGELTDPIALYLSIDGLHLLVLDAEARAVFVYDVNGTFLRRLDYPFEGYAVSIKDTSRGLALAYRSGIAISHEGGWSKWENPNPAEPIADIHIVGDKVYLLTRSRLYEYRIP